MSYSIHPACAKWPRPSELEFAALVADIKTNGLLNSIWLYDDQILEGKLRYEACLRAEVEPRFEIYTGDDPIGFTISHNKLRRHMTSVQLSFIGEELSKLKAHRPNNSVRERSKSQAEIAQELGVNERSFQHVRVLNEHAAPNVIELVKTNQVNLQTAATYARSTSRDVQRKATSEIVKTEGYALRTPYKNGAKSRSKVIPSIPFSTEQWQVLSEKLRPMIKRLRFQSKQHITLFAPFELELIACEMEKFLDSLANAATDAPRKASN